MKKILIIDDDPIATTGYQRLLQAHDYQVEVARDGEAGLERLRAFGPDAVLLDLVMPKVNGHGVLGSIRAQAASRELPVLVMTTAFDPMLMEQTLRAGASRVFDKSKDKPLSVIEALHELLQATPQPIPDPSPVPGAKL